MAEPTSFARLLSELGSRIGIAELRPTPEGTCTLEFDTKLAVHLCAPGGANLLTASMVIGETHLEDCELFRHVLEANLFWRGTGGATFGLELGPETATIAMVDRRPLDSLDVAQLETWLQGFVDLGEKWIDCLAARASGQRSTSPEFQFEPVAGMIRV